MRFDPVQGRTRARRSSPRLKTRYSTCRTAARRSERSASCGKRNRAPLTLIRCLARLMRWATVASGTQQRTRDLGGGQPAHRPQRPARPARRVSRRDGSRAGAARASRPTQHPVRCPPALRRTRPPLGDAVPIRSATSPCAAGTRQPSTTLAGWPATPSRGPLRRRRRGAPPARRPRRCRSRRSVASGPREPAGDRDRNRSSTSLGVFQMSHPSRAMMGRNLNQPERWPRESARPARRPAPCWGHSSRKKPARYSFTSGIGPVGDQRLTLVRGHPLGE